MESSLLRYSRKRDRCPWRVISDAIEGQNCPICLRILDRRRAVVLRVCKHAYCLSCIRRWSDLKRTCPICTATFDSWFYDIDIYSRRLFTKRLAPLPEDGSINRQPLSGFSGRRRIIGQAREDSRVGSWRTRPLPWRRSFGPPGSVPSNVIAERKLQWRASIYTRGLQVIPFSPTISAQQNRIWSRCEKEKALHRIEPWIRRELEAILGDPDPSIIVHVASSIFISSLEGRSNVASGDCGVENGFLAPLRPFLQEKTDLFWHELRSLCETDAAKKLPTYATTGCFTLLPMTLLTRSLQFMFM